MTAVDVNLYGTVHGGVLMKFIDDVAGAAAARHSGGTAVTAAIDEIVFSEPVRVGDLIHAHAQVNWTGKTSMEIGIKVVAERWDSAEQEPVRVATAYLVFVGVDLGGGAAGSAAGAAGDRRGPAPVPGGGNPPGAPAQPAARDSRAPRPLTGRRRAACPPGAIRRSLCAVVDAGQGLRRTSHPPNMGATRAAPLKIGPHNDAAG